VSIFFTLISGWGTASGWTAAEPEGQRELGWAFRLATTGGRNYSSPLLSLWSRLTNGDPLFTRSQVALNDTIMVFAFAPLVGFLLGISAITVPWDTLLTSVGLYIVIPVILAQWWRKSLLARGSDVLDAAMSKTGPWSITALLGTLVLLFAFQGEAIIQQPMVIGLLAVPILIQVFFNSALAYWLNRQLGEKHSVACPSALIGASNFFELAVAAAISLFGFQSGAALATVVGVLIEVPVMLLVVRAVNNTQGWYAKH
jgi:arsenite transporter